jgi:hypothetical protein
MTDVLSREAALRQFRQWLKDRIAISNERMNDDGFPLATRADFYVKSEVYTWTLQEFDRLGLGETREEQP